MTFDIQVVWEESVYLRDGLLRQKNVSKVHVKDPTHNLNKERLHVWGLFL